MARTTANESPDAWRAARSEFGAGWKTFLAAMLGYGTGASNYGVYIVPTIGVSLQDVYGWSRTETSSLTTMVFLGSLLGTPLVGWIVDRFSPRWPALISMIAVGGVLLLASLIPPVPAAWQIGTLLFGLLAAGSTAVTHSRLICDQFRAARGLAIGAMMGSLGLFGALLGYLYGTLIPAVGLSQTFMIVGGTILCVITPLMATLLWSRGKPKIGVEPAEAERPAAVSPGRFPWFIFAVLAGTAILTCASATGGATHLVPLARDAGSASFASITVVFALTVALTRPTVGALADRIHGPWVGTAYCALSAVGLALIPLYGAQSALAAAVLVGVSVGGEVDLVAYLVSRYFPTHLYGRTFSALYILMMATTALSPLFVAMAYQRLGGYAVPFAVLSILAVAAAGLFLLLPRYERLAPGSH